LTDEERQSAADEFVMPKFDAERRRAHQARQWLTLAAAVV